MTKRILVLILVFLVPCSVIVVYCSSGEIDGTAVVTGVHDGDTFYIDRNFHGSDTIRLADINASELGQPESYEARDFLIGLINHKMVYLDIDDKYIFDYHGVGDRLVCVVYVNYNSTHYMNVNRALLDEGLAELKDYENEFNPTTWTVYTASQDIVPEFQSCLFPPIFMIMTLVAVTVYRRKRTRYVPGMSQVQIANVGG